MLTGFLFQFFGKVGRLKGGNAADRGVMAQDAFMTFNNAGFKSVYKSRNVIQGADNLNVSTHL